MSNVTSILSSDRTNVSDSTYPTLKDKDAFLSLKPIFKPMPEISTVVSVHSTLSINASNSSIVIKSTSTKSQRWTFEDSMRTFPIVDSRLKSESSTSSRNSGIVSKSPCSTPPRFEMRFINPTVSILISKEISDIRIPSSSTPT